jgi:uncharacterized membrane protein YgcG
MLKFIKRLFCHHTDATFVRNIYGDEIIRWGYKRSLWRCTKCGQLHAKDGLHHEPRAAQSTSPRMRPPAPPNPPRTTVAPARSSLAPTAANSTPASTEDFGTSMAVAMATNNAALGFLVGGSITGAVVGDMLRDDTPTKTTSTSVDCGTSSSSDWSSSSSYDTGSCSSSDSGSSWSSD